MKIFLIGMMGSGKSYWAQLLAKKLKTNAYDLDELVESLEERTISAIFAEEGEAYFRKEESKLLRWFAEKNSFVLATGGGTPCFNKNINWMNEQGTTVWLNEPIPVLAERLKKEKDHRPLIKDLSDDELHIFLEKKLAERIEHYQQAKYAIVPSAISEKEFINLIKKEEKKN